MTDGRRRFALFVLAGGIAALVNIASRILLNTAMPYEVAIIVAYVCGMTTAYALNRLFVFARSGRAVADEYVRFTLVNLVAVAQVWVVSVGLARLVFPALGFAGTPTRSRMSSASSCRCSPAISATSIFRLPPSPHRIRVIAERIGVARRMRPGHRGFSRQWEFSRLGMPWPTMYSLAIQART